LSTGDLAYKEHEEFKVLFNFNFELLKNSHQQLYLSQDKKRLLAVCDKTTATIYRIELPDGVDNVADLNGELIEWKAETKINQFPQLLQGNTSANFLFSPNFDYMIDVHYGNN
jgi:hypothetical protein